MYFRNIKTIKCIGIVFISHSDFLRFDNSSSDNYRFLFFSPDIHSGTKIDLVTSLMSLNQSILLSSDSQGLPGYYHQHIPVHYFYDPSNPQPQLILPNYPIIKKGESPNISRESVLIRFYQRIINHPSFRPVDCVVCMFYPGQCQYFVPFNKTVLFLPAHRFLLQRCKRNEVFSLLYAMFAYPDHVLVRAAGRYDAEYIQYFTGIQVPIIYASSLFAYPEPQQYSPVYDEFLIAPFKYKDIQYYNEITEACMRHAVSCNLTTVLQKFGNKWSFQELYRFKAIIVFPYAVLSYYLNDIFASGTPMFVPSPRFLIQLDLLHDIRNSDPVYCGKFFQPLNKHSQSHHPFSPEDPSEEAVLYWLQFATFYTPASIQFDSWDDLAMKMKTTNYTEKFNQRIQENRQIKRHNVEEWKKVMKQIEKNRVIPSSYEEAKVYFNVDSFY